MANRKVTVLNPAGYQELFQTGDNLLMDGSINLQLNALTGLPTPGVDSAGANKKYVDDADDLLSVEIGSIDTRLDALEANVDLADYVRKDGSTMTGFLTLSSSPNDLLHAAPKQYVDNTVINAIGDGSITLSATQNVSISGTNSFTANQSGDVTIDIVGPDLSTYIQTTDDIDLGTY